VVNPHRRLIDVRLERVVVVGERRNFVGHWLAPRRRFLLGKPVLSDV
jgi:hypothetical protein